MNELVSLMDAAKMGLGATSAQINYWTIYTMVLGAVISLFGSGYIKKLSSSGIAMIAFGFFVFSLANGAEIFFLQENINRVSEAIEGYTKEFSGSISKHFLPLFQMHRHISSLAVASFHFCLDIVVLYLFLKYYKIVKLKERKLAGLTQ